MREKARPPLPHRRIAAADDMPILERLSAGPGARDRRAEARHGFPVEGGNYNVFRFDRTLHSGSGYAFHVKRDEFDQLLFEHARARAWMRATG